jgi:two-component system, cell cycle sensor histidine kinase and response regulator CckA
VTVASDAPVSQSALRGGLILVVDDEPILRENTAELLSCFGYRVQAVADGAEAVAWVRSHPGEAGLVLLDMHMPRMDGAQTFAALRGLEPGLPVILTSGSSGGLAIEDMLRQGLKGVLSKPMSAKAMLQAVAAILPPDAPA